MDKIILSLLLIKSMTIYEIRGFISMNLNSVCSDSIGSIQAALKKLVDSKFVTYKEFVENSLNKKEYSITDEGVKEFVKWIEIPIQIGKAKNMEEGKFFFMGIAPAKTRIKVIREYIKGLKKEQKKFLEIQKFIESTKNNIIEQNVERICKDKELYRHMVAVSESESLDKIVSNIYKYQLLNLKYGLERVQFDIVFFEEILLKEMEEV